MSCVAAGLPVQRLRRWPGVEPWLGFRGGWGLAGEFACGSASGSGVSPLSGSLWFCGGTPDQPGQATRLVRDSRGPALHCDSTPDRSQAGILILSVEISGQPDRIMPHGAPIHTSRHLTSTLGDIHTH